VRPPHRAATPFPSTPLPLPPLAPPPVRVGRRTVLFHRRDIILLLLLLLFHRLKNVTILPSLTAFYTIIQYFPLDLISNLRVKIVLGEGRGIYSATTKIIL